MDASLSKRLNELWAQNDRMKAAEHLYLSLEANRKALLAQLTIKAEGKSFAEREAHAYASDDWKIFCIALVNAETDFNFERRKWEVLDKAYLAEHATYKIDNEAIRKPGA